MTERDELNRARLDQLRREISLGIDQADRGQVRPFDEATINWIKAQGRKKLEFREGAEPG